MTQTLNEVANEIRDLIKDSQHAKTIELTHDSKDSKTLIDVKVIFEDGSGWHYQRKTAEEEFSFSGIGMRKA